MDKVKSDIKSAEVGTPRWVKGRNGYIAGVCDGLGKNYGIEPGILRALFVVGIFLSLGFAILIYLALAVCLPKEDYVGQAQEPKVFGVCSAISERFGFEVGIVRFVTVMLALSSFGLTIVAYIAAYFALPAITRGTSHTLRR